MGQALYRKHRPKSLSEVIGQEHITETLEKAIASGRISHAYLFTGPKGVGKTSIARILAHAINGLPYTDEAAHLDIIEIDAASNRRIDEIRELRDKVYVAPTSAKYKVYIIDEVHMLTREAFNALLKTLEEPPAHVVFILATTDAHKLPETIISRTQRYTFRPVESDKVIRHLRHIAKQEKIAISDEALALLATHGEGSFRDSISLLDQASNHEDKVELAAVQSLLGIPPLQSIDELIASIQSKNGQQALQTLVHLYEQGYQAAGIAKQLAQRVRHDITAGTLGISGTAALQLLAKLIEVPASHDPERYLEIVLLETGVPSTNTAPAARPVTQPAQETVVNAEPSLLAESQQTKSAKPKAMPEKIPEVPQPESKRPASARAAIIDEAVWPQVLDALKKKYNTLYGIIRMAQPNFATKGVVELSFAFAFHQKRIMDAKNRTILADIIASVTGQDVEVICKLDKDLQAKKPAAAIAPQTKAADPADLNTISNIFGGAELLES